MIVDGYYEGEFAALFRREYGQLLLEKGQLHGLTQRGTRITGTYELDVARNTYRYDALARMAPFFEMITGVVIGKNGRTFHLRGEVTPLNGKVRFSLDVAGRAIDVVLVWAGPVEMGASLRLAALQEPGNR